MNMTEICRKIYSSILAWRIPGTEEPGRLQLMGSRRVAHDQATNTFTFTFITGGDRILNPASLRNQSSCLKKANRKFKESLFISIALQSVQLVP